ncbi:MAG TPA: zinc ribbon domain-containing protein [Gemmatimonadaceae bacterium]|nr:zinc ribbon domain-containing protein [Gemmatimonadaceae bacterium]
MSSSTPPNTSATCPNCSAPASGRFCASCGAPLEGAACSTCRVPLTPGAKFCHRCGTPAGAAAPTAAAARSDTSGFPAALPWAVAGIALLALIALLAGQRFNGARTAQADNAASASAAGAAGAVGPEAGGMAGAGVGVAPVRAPDISQMSPRERADRLYDRVMRLSEEGKQDSVNLFAQMGISAYQMLPEQDADTRYDMGRIAEVAGALPMARAQADSILASDPNHLLGIILAISTARAAGDSAGVQSFEAKLLSAQSSELARNLPEYQRHEREIAAAVDAAKKQGAKS